jgi:hypothetical protein
MGGWEIFLAAVILAIAAFSTWKWNAQRRTPEPGSQLLVITDPLFGRLEHDTKLKQLTSATHWCGREIRLSLWLDDVSRPEAVVASAHRLFREMEAWDHKVKNCAVRHLLEVSAEWAQADTPALTPEEFTARLTLESITFSSENTFEFWYDDGDMFAGHQVSVSANFEDGPLDASI